MRPLGASNAAIGSLRGIAAGCALRPSARSRRAARRSARPKAASPRPARSRGSPRRSSDRRRRRPRRHRSRGADSSRWISATMSERAAAPLRFWRRRLALRRQRRDRAAQRCDTGARLVGEDRRRMRPRLHEQRIDQDRDGGEAGDRGGHRIPRPAQHRAQHEPPMNINGSRPTDRPPNSSSLIALLLLARIASRRFFD